MRIPPRSPSGLWLTLILTLAVGVPGQLDVAGGRRALRHAELLEQLEVRLAAAKDPPQAQQAKAAAAADQAALATALATVRLEADLLARVAPVERLPGQKPQAVVKILAALAKSAREELTLARFAFLVGEVDEGEAALSRARDADPELAGETDGILAAARGEPVPRGGYFRYRGRWLALAERNLTRALDDALEALAEVELEGLKLPVRPAADRPNRERFESLGAGVGAAVMRQATQVIRKALGADYAAVRSWLPSYADPGLRKRLLDAREAMRPVQGEALALIRRYAKFEQGRVDEYRNRLQQMYGEFEQLVQRDFLGVDRLDPAKAWALHERLRRREGALVAVDRYFELARLPRLDAGQVRPARGSTVTTAHLLPGRRLSGLEDALWLLVKHASGQVMDVFQRGAEILRHAGKLTPWERLLLETVTAAAVDAYNARVAVSLDAVERDFVRVLNRYRRTLGLLPFELEERLNVSAKKHSQEMVDLGYFGHISPVPRNRGPTDRARLEGYNGGVGENCLGGRADGAGAFSGWYHSPGHHRGMIGGGPHLGVGAVADHSMWTMVAGGADWTWRTLHGDLPPAERQRLRKLVDEFVTWTVRGSAKPAEDIVQRAEQARREVVAAIPRVLPDVARIGFAAARDRRSPAHRAFPDLLALLIGAEVGVTWRALQVAAVAAAIEGMRSGSRPELREAAFGLVGPLLGRRFDFDPNGADQSIGESLEDIRRHWEDVAQWRFRAAPDAVPPSGRRMAGRDRPGLDAARRMLSRKERLRLARLYGGGSKTEQAVDRGLEFLARVQDEDGGWRARSFPLRLPRLKGKPHGGNADWEVAMTGLALLAFTSAGHGPSQGEHQQVVAKGARFLASRMVDYGRFETTSSHYMYNHALATQALCEVYAYSADPHLGACAQLAVDFLVYAQHPLSGGWRYEANQHGDTSVTGWVIMALNSAFKADLDVSGFRGAMRFLDEVTQRPYYRVGYVNPMDGGTQGERLTAVAMTGRLFLGAKLDDSRLVLPAYRIIEQLPTAGTVDFYYWYYATLALFQIGEPFFGKWNKALMPVLLESQDQKSSDGLRGSWAPQGPWSEHGGRIYQTALAILMLTTYYRYDRSPKVRLYPYTGDITKAIGPMLAAIRDESDPHRQRIAMRKVVDSFGSSLVGAILPVVRDAKQDLKYRRRLASLLPEVAVPRHAAMFADLLQVDDEEIASWAVRAFVRVASRDSVDALVHHLGNRHRNVRAFCAANLGRLGDPRAVSGLDTRLKVEGDPWVKGELQGALQQLARRAKLTGLLGRALRADEPGYLEVQEGLLPLEQDGLVEPLLEMQQSEPELHGRALAAIREHRRGAAVPLLFLLMESRNPDLRTRAVKLLQAITRKTFRFDPQAQLSARKASLVQWREWWRKSGAGFGGR